jgi:hypothetical protein
MYEALPLFSAKRGQDIRYSLVFEVTSSASGCARAGWSIAALQQWTQRGEGPQGREADPPGQSNHGFVLAATLPTGAVAILSAGPNTTHVAAFSYALGRGDVYYSTIPLDFYLSGFGPFQVAKNFQTIYTPNMLDYAAVLLAEEK